MIKIGRIYHCRMCFHFADDKKVYPRIATCLNGVNGVRREFEYTDVHGFEEGCKELMSECPLEDFQGYIHIDDVIANMELRLREVKRYEMRWRMAEKKANKLEQILDRLEDKINEVYKWVVQSEK